MNPKFFFASIVLLPMLLVACGDQEVSKAKNPAVPIIDCETNSVQDKLLKNLASKFIEEGAKGYSTSELKELLAVKESLPLDKSANKGYSKCSAQVTIKYPPNLAENVGKFFLTESAYVAFKNELEDRYGVVAGAGMHAQLMDAVADGPFGVVPFAPDPASIAKHRKTIEKNLGALIQEQLDVAVSYELNIGTDPNGKPFEQLKWQINKREALDINVVLLSLNGLL
jgi:hypothetical protein